MSDITKGRTWVSGETITPERQNAMMDDAVIAAGALSADATGRAKMADGFLSADATGLAKMADGFLSADATGLAKMADGFLSADATGRAKMADGFVDYTKVAAGAVVQMAYDEEAGYTLTSSVIPLDDTKPLVSEGAELLSATITPKSSTNKIVIDVSIPYIDSNGASSGIFSIFQGSTCLQTSVISVAATNYRTHIKMHVVDIPAATSPVTYSVRYGSAGTYNIYINGYGSRLFGGASKATMTLTEIKA